MLIKNILVSMLALSATAFAADQFDISVESQAVKNELYTLESEMIDKFLNDPNY